MSEIEKSDEFSRFMLNIDTNQLLTTNDFIRAAYLKHRTLILFASLQPISIVYRFNAIGLYYLIF